MLPGLFTGKNTGFFPGRGIQVEFCGINIIFRGIVNEFRGNTAKNRGINPFQRSKIEKSTPEDTK